MINTVMARRFESTRGNRLYRLPEGVTVTPGTVLTVEYLPGGQTAMAYATQDSREYDEHEALLVGNLFGFRDPTLQSLKRVTSVYAETKLDWGDPEASDAAETAEDADPEAEDADEE